jgi:ATP-binding cassette subfamily B protein/subfamily B ATP-binding cassette protein MsbA
MKTGAFSRLTGDVDTTTGLLQMAVVSPAISIIRLDRRRRLMTLNWCALIVAIIPASWR